MFYHLTSHCTETKDALCISTGQIELVQDRGVSQQYLKLPWLNPALSGYSSGAYLCLAMLNKSKLLSPAQGHQ